MASAAKLYALTSCATRNASRDKPSRKSPAIASRGAYAIACTTPSRPSQAFARLAKSAPISASFETSQGNTSLLSNSPAISVTRSLKRSFWYVNASAAPSRRAASAMPCAIERLESRPVTRTRLPASKPI